MILYNTVKKCSSFSIFVNSSTQTSDIYWLLPFHSVMPMTLTLFLPPLFSYDFSASVCGGGAGSKRKKIIGDTGPRSSHSCYNCHSPSSQGNFSMVLLFFLEFNTEMLKYIRKDVNMKRHFCFEIIKFQTVFSVLITQIRYFI